MSALKYLVSLIEQGYEYPDAEWKASQKYNVSPDKLRDLYDGMTSDFYDNIKE